MHRTVRRGYCRLSGVCCLGTCEAQDDRDESPRCAARGTDKSNTRNITCTFAVCLHYSLRNTIECMRSSLNGQKLMREPNTHFSAVPSETKHACPRSGRLQPYNGPANTYSAHTSRGKRKNRCIY